jgi:hypothetical protein
MHPSTYKAKAYSAASETAPMASTTIPRREPTDRDVQIEILFVASAIRTFIQFAMNGASSWRRTTQSFLAMKSSAV